MNSELEESMEEIESMVSKNIELIDADFYLNTKPPPDDPVIQDIFEKGDKVMLVGGSKSQKSFFILQLAMCIAMGRDLFNWTIPTSWRTLLIQFELQEKHYHRRVNAMAHSMKAGSFDGKLKIINGRKRAAKILDTLESLIKDFAPEVIIFDPLYKLMPGGENSAEDIKPILTRFDVIAENTGAAIIYVHHTTKGSQRGKNTIDVGAGSGVLARDWDAQIFLARTKEHWTIDTITRNYPDPDSFTAQWVNNRFVLCDPQIPCKTHDKQKVYNSKQTQALIMAHLQSAPDSSQSNIHKALKGKASEKDVTHTLKILEKEGVIVRGKRKGQGGGYAYQLNNINPPDEEL